MRLSFRNQNEMGQKRKKIREKGYENEMNAFKFHIQLIKEIQKKNRGQAGENREVIIKEIMHFPELKPWDYGEKVSQPGINKTVPAHIRWDFQEKDNRLRAGVGTLTQKLRPEGLRPWEGYFFRPSQLCILRFCIWKTPMSSFLLP